MIVICTHQSPQVLETLLASIRRFSTEKHRILVVETSQSHISKDIAHKYDAIFENTEKKYEIGAYQHAIKTYPNEKEYFMFQDSLEIIQHGWEEHYRILSNETRVVAMASYPLKEDPCPGCGAKEFYEITGQQLPEDANAILCNCFYMPQKAKNQLIEAGFNKMYANDKNDTYGTERVLGSLAHISCGFECVATILGNWIWHIDHFVPNHGFNIFIQKYSLKRQ